MKKPRMPGEDELIRGQQELAAGLKHIFDVFGNYLTMTTVQVVPGDTLWNLAKTHLGDGQRWRELYFLNYDVITKGEEQHRARTDPSSIYPGTQLRVLAF